MLRESSRHDGLPINQAARDRQRERQKQERAQMLVPDEPGVSPSIQHLFNEPVKVLPAIEDPTSIEIRKTFGNYDSALPFLTDKNGALQGRLIGVDHAGGGSNPSTPQKQPAPTLEPSHRVKSFGGSTGASVKPSVPPAVPQNRSAPSTASNPKDTSKPDIVQNLFKHIPSAKKPNPAAKPPSHTSQHPVNPPSSSQSIGQTQDHIQIPLHLWNVPTPLSPFPVRKQTKLSTTTLPITFVNASSLNTISTTTSDVGDFSKPIQKSNHNTQNNLSTNSIKTSATSSSSSSAVKGELSIPSASFGAPISEKVTEQHTFKKPLERSDSRLDLDSMIREMTDVGSPLSAILPKDSPPKKVTPRRASKSDERTIEALEGIHELKNNLSPLSTTGMNSSSSSSESSTSDSDSDSDSTSGSEQTPTTTPVKSAPNTRSPTERESWSLSSFVGNIRKENAPVEAASTSSDSKAASSHSHCLETVPESSTVSQKSEINVSSSTTAAKFGNSVTGTIAENSKALIKSASGFTKPSVSQTKHNKDHSALGFHSKGSTSSTKKPVFSNKGKVPPVLSKAIAAFPALLQHKDPTLSGSSSEDEGVPSIPAPPIPKPKEKDKTPPKPKLPSKRPATVNEEAPLPTKKPRRKNSISAGTSTPQSVTTEKIITPPEKNTTKSEDKHAKIKSLDRNKNGMIGKVFRPKKDKTEDGSRDKDGSNGTSTSPQHEKSSKQHLPAASNRVSAKDSGRKSSSVSASSSIASTKTNGDAKALDKSESKLTHSNVSNSLKSKRSTSPPSKGVLQKSNGNSNRTILNYADKPERRASNPKGKKGDSESASPKGKRSSDSPKRKSAGAGSPKSKRLSDAHHKTKTSSKDKKEITISKSSSGSKLPKDSSLLKSSSTTNISSKTPSKAMPPPPPPPPQTSSSTHNSLKDGKKESKKKDDKTRNPLPPFSFFVSIPIKNLPRIPKVTKAAELAPPFITHSSKKSQSKQFRDEKKEEIRLKAHTSNPSLVGSSVEDVTDTNVPTKTQRASGLPDQTKSANKDQSKDSSSGHKRTKSKAHSSSKKPRLMDGTEIDIKADSERHASCELSSPIITPYTSGVPAAKTPPDPPDSSLNPTHSGSPMLALPQPQYLSYYEKVEHHEDFFAYDNTYYINEAKILKHRADKEETGVRQIFTYLDSAQYFILSGILMERSVGRKEAYTMYRDTNNLIRHISNRPRARLEDPQEVKLMVLAFRIQSLLSLQLYKYKSRDIVETSHYLSEILTSKNVAHDYLPPPVTRSPQTTLSTPSPQPVLSPAGSGPTSVGSVSQPSIHSPHHQTQQQVVLSKSLYHQMSIFCTSSTMLITAYDQWENADSLVEQFHVQDVFISMDRSVGPLTFHSSLLDLVRYVRCALKIIKLEPDG